ncbi:MAG: tandem-95 repeat protein, partial [Parachlamydiaceae bacterium]
INYTLILMKGSLADLNQELNGLIFRPNENYNGPASISIQTQEMSTAEHLFSQDTITLAINPINDAPLGVDKTYSFISGDSLQVSGTLGLLQGASDVENDSLQTFVVTQPKNGLLILYVDGSFRYTPNPDFVGTDSFTYKINDGSNDSVVHSVTLNVIQTAALPAAMITPSNEPQVIFQNLQNGTQAIINVTPAQAEGVSEESVLKNVQITSQESPGKDNATDTILIKPQHGQVWIDEKGIINYLPSEGFYGKDEFVIKINSETGEKRILVSVEVIASNAQAPKPVIFAQGADEAMAYIGSLTQGAVTFSTTTPIAAMSQMIVKHNDPKEIQISQDSINDLDSSDRTVNTVAAIAITMDPSDLPEGLTVFDSEQDTGSSASLVIEALKNASKNKPA